MGGCRTKANDVCLSSGRLKDRLDLLHAMTSRACRVFSGGGFVELPF